MLSFFPEFLRNINNFVEKEATSVMLLKDIILHVYVHHIIPYTAVINFITLIYVFLNNLNCLGCRMHHPPATAMLRCLFAYSESDGTCNLTVLIFCLNHH